MPSRTAQILYIPDVNAKLLVVYALLAVAIFANNGAFLPLVPLGLLGVLGLLVRAFSQPGPPVRQAWLYALLTGSWLLALARTPGPPGHWLTVSGVGLGCYFALTFGLLAVVVLALHRGRAAGAQLGIVLLLYAAAGVLLLRLTPQPAIDVHWLQQGGALDLLAGKNPYASSVPNLYSAEDTLQFFGDHRTRLGEYPYPPLSLLGGTLGFLLAADVRYFFLLAQLASAVFLHRLARRQHGESVALGLAALWLLHPRGLFVLEQSWTEPLACAAFLGFLYFSDGKWLWASLFFGAKQYSVLLLPLLRPPLPRWLWLGLGAAALVVAPFFLWSPHDFIGDLFWFQIRQPFRPDAMSLPALIYWATGWRAPGALAGVGLLGAYVSVYRLFGRQSTRSAATLAASAAIVYFAFFLCAKQAFCNYYYFVGALILAAVATDARSLATKV